MRQKLRPILRLEILEIFLEGFEVKDQVIWLRFSVATTLVGIGIVHTVLARHVVLTWAFFQISLGIADWLLFTEGVRLMSSHFGI